jgi:hypothetical protein
VSLGMVLVGALTPLRGALLSFVQILGAITVSPSPSPASCVLRPASWCVEKQGLLSRG